MSKRAASISLACAIAGLTMIALLAEWGHRARLQGTVTTTDYVIPADEVVTVVGDVTINASRRIEIDGTLYLAPGATVTFQSPSVNVRGSVERIEMHVGWWRRATFAARHLLAAAMARMNRMLGRTPNYWARGPLGCFGPQPAAAAPTSSSAATNPQR